MKKKYFLVSILTLLIISIVFILKGIFPFGSTSIIWSDMHEQVTAIYYHFYDAVKNGSSLLVDFNSGGGINFLGVIAYYILSPFSLILLFFPRDMVFNAVSIVVALKVVTSSITSLYFLDKYFKNIKDSLKILLSILYAFSGYTLSLYVITTWMDAVYLLPIFLIGLKELLDLENTKKYIITLSLLLIFSFYISFMFLIFVILSSLVYLYIYKKENMKKAIFNLGISTFISLLISSVIVLPTAVQIFSSQRVGFDIDYIAGSRLGPFSDKLSYLFVSGTFIAAVILFILNYKKDKKFTLFLLINLLLVGLGIIIEPINKLWHLGSYVYFPYRYGILLIMILLIGCAKFFDSTKKIEIKNIKINKFVPFISLIVTICLTVVVMLKYRISILEAINHLTFTRDKTAIIALFIIFFFNLLSALLIIYTYFEDKKKMSIMLYLLVIPNIIFNTYLYVHPKDEKILKDQYIIMNNMYNDRGPTNYYIKDKDKILISNFGMVSGFNTYSSFTSLTEKNNFMTMQNLGYDSFWMDTRSMGGNLFTDILLSQKYIISKDELNDSYYELLKEEDGIYYYEFKNVMPYGFIIGENASLSDVKNSFEASNIIYNSIANDNAFEIEKIYESDDKNIKENEMFVKNINITNKRRVYLELFTDFSSSEKAKSYKSFDIYVNGNKFYESFPDDFRNGVLYLGEYENSNLEIKVISKKKTILRNITVGLLDLEKIDNLLYRDNPTVSLDFHKNNIKVNVESSTGGILFLPLTYLDGFKSNHELIKVFDNFLGIKINSGEEVININYVPKGLKLGFILTGLGIILSFIWIKFVQNIKLPFFENITFYLYVIGYALITIVFYVIMPLLFIKSFIIK